MAHMNKGKWLGKYSRPMEHLGKPREVYLVLPFVGDSKFGAPGFAGLRY